MAHSGEGEGSPGPCNSGRPAELPNPVRTRLQAKGRQKALAEGLEEERARSHAVLRGGVARLAAAALQVGQHTATSARRHAPGGAGRGPDGGAARRGRAKAHTPELAPPPGVSPCCAENSPPEGGASPAEPPHPLPAAGVMGTGGPGEPQPFRRRGVPLGAAGGARAAGEGSGEARGRRVGAAALAGKQAKAVGAMTALEAANAAAGQALTACVGAECAQRLASLAEVFAELAGVSDAATDTAVSMLPNGSGAEGAEAAAHPAPGRGPGGLGGCSPRAGAGLADVVAALTGDR